MPRVTSMREVISSRYFATAQLARNSRFLLQNRQAQLSRQRLRCYLLELAELLSEESSQATTKTTMEHAERATIGRILYCSSTSSSQSIKFSLRFD